MSGWAALPLAVLVVLGGAVTFIAVFALLLWAFEKLMDTIACRFGVRAIETLEAGFVTLIALFLFVVFTVLAFQHLTGRI